MLSSACLRALKFSPQSPNSCQCLCRISNIIALYSTLMLAGPRVGIQYCLHEFAPITFTATAIALLSSPESTRAEPLALLCAHHSPPMCSTIPLTHPFTQLCLTHPVVPDLTPDVNMADLAPPQTSAVPDLAPDISHARPRPRWKSCRTSPWAATVPDLSSNINRVELHLRWQPCRTTNYHAKSLSFRSLLDFKNWFQIQVGVIVIILSLREDVNTFI